MTQPTTTPLELMQITEDEFTRLIEEATPQNRVPIRFGPGWIALENTPAADWARARVKEMRAAFVSEFLTADEPKEQDHALD